MQILPDWLKNGYLRLMDPIAEWLIRRRVHPNTITIVGTILTVAGGVIYGTGHISVGGWFLGITALTDVLDGMVADGAVLGGLAVFYALDPVHHSVPMVISCLAGIIGAFLTSYTRARAEALGLDAKVGFLQRAERVVLLSAPQAFFGLLFNGWVLAIIINLLTIAAWVTVIQRMKYVYDKTRTPATADAEDRDSGPYKAWDRPSVRRDTAARPALKGE
jgi:CDP-diacylglycerol--glycerol-3-phosphate 3-phosphatidyltransferase